MLLEHDPHSPHPPGPGWGQAREQTAQVWVEGWLSPRCDLARAQPSYCLICGMELHSSPGALWFAECCWRVCGKSS